MMCCIRSPAAWWPWIGVALLLVAGCHQEETGPTAVPASITIDPQTITLDLTASTTLRATVKDASGATLPGAPVTWASSDPQVAGVTAAGVVTGIGLGAASITASSGSLSASADVTVQQVIGSISIEPPAATLVVGQTQQLTATVRDARGNVMPGAAVTWASSDDAAAAVTALGLVTAAGAGASNLSASSGTIKGSALVKVVGITPAKAQRQGQTLWTGPSPNRWGDLYTAAAIWPTVQSRSHVVKLYIDDIHAASPRGLRDVVGVLDQAHIAIAVEVGGLRDWNCSGASLAALELGGIKRLVDAGGAVSFLAMDAPFGYTLATSIPGNCGYTVQQTSEQLVAYIHAARQALPGVRIGLIEPVPWYSVGAYPPNPGNNFGDLPQVLDTFLTILAQHGESIDFFHADSPYDYAQAHPAGWDKLLALQTVVRGYGLRFGLIYNSDIGGTTGDQPFHDQTLAAVQAFQAAGGSPDDFIFQSWYPFPSVMAPEDQAFTFTNDVKDGIALYDQLYP